MLIILFGLNLQAGAEHVSNQAAGKQLSTTSDTKSKLGFNFSTNWNSASLHSSSGRSNGRKISHCKYISSGSSKINKVCWDLQYFSEMTALRFICLSHSFTSPQEVHAAEVRRNKEHQADLSGWTLFSTPGRRGPRLWYSCTLFLSFQMYPFTPTVHFSGTDTSCCSAPSNTHPSVCFSVCQSYSGALGTFAVTRPTDSSRNKVDLWAEESLCCLVLNMKWGVEL